MPPKNTKRSYQYRFQDLPLVPTGSIAVDVHSAPVRRESNSRGSTNKKRKESAYFDVQAILAKLICPPPPLEVPSTEGVYTPEPICPGSLADSEVINGAGIRLSVEKKHLSRNRPLHAWLLLRDEYLHATLRSEGRGTHSHICAQCKMADPPTLFRCLTCFGRHNLCESCATHAHTDEPLHVLKKWNGSYWEDADLRVFGISVQLGHLPGTCCSMPQRENKAFHVIHTDGVHAVHVLFCNCKPGYSLRDQVIDAGWWPTSVEFPESAVTEDALRLFDHANGCGKISTYHWCQTLVELTVPAGLVKLSNIYDGFKLVMRQYWHIKMLKRAGRGHLEGGVSGTQPGELAVPCRACPHSFTLPLDWKKQPPQIGWKNKTIVNIDANYRLNERERSSMEADPAMGPGWAYVLDHQSYLKSLNLDANKEQSVSHCSGFNALSMANSKKSRGLRATGVGMVACARHEIVRPQGIGDLQVGERYSNMDYIFFSSVSSADLYHLAISYDIACQWSKNFWTRMVALPESLHLDIPQSSVSFFVPKFHLAAHKPECQLSYSFNLRPRIGRTDGEGIERIWSALNRISSATKEMGPGGRHDMIDVHVGRQNWAKIKNLGQQFTSRMASALSNVGVHFQAFLAFTLSLKTENSATVEEWERMVEAWEADSNAPNPFECKSADMTLAELRTTVAQEEADKSSLDGFDPIQDKREASDFLIEILDLERISLGIQLDANKNTITPTEALALQQRRSALSQRLNRLADAQQQFMPGLKTWLPQQDQSRTNVNAERCNLWPPSTLPSDVRQSVCISGLSHLEARICHFDALDKLRTLRNLLRTRTVAHRFKRNNLTGLAANTRAHGFLMGLERRIHITTFLYRQNYTALLSLEGPGDWQKVIRPLQKEDVVGLSERLLLDQERDEFLRTERQAEELMNAPTRYREIIQPGEGRRLLSWIWYDVSKEEMSNDITRQLGEGIRVEWAKTRARYHRWKEEVELLDEEMRRVLEFGAWKAKWWEECAKINLTLSRELSEGLQAYALEHADVERRMARLFNEMWLQLRERAQLMLKEQDRVLTLALQQGDVLAKEIELENIDVTIHVSEDNVGYEDSDDE